MNYLEQFKLKQMQQLKNIKMEAYRNINEKFEDDNVVETEESEMDDNNVEYEGSEMDDNYNEVDHDEDSNKNEELVLTLEEVEPDRKFRGTYY